MVLTFKLLADQNDSHEELDRKRALTQLSPRQLEAGKGDQNTNDMMLPQDSVRSDVTAPPRFNPLPQHRGTPQLDPNSLQVPRPYISLM